jgi:hypothetical protein
VAAKAPQEKPKLLSIPVIIVLVTVALGGVAFWALHTFGAKGPQEVVLTPEGKDYVKNLGLADVEMKATTSYLGQDVVEITGKITNKGDRDLRQVDLRCIFYDPYNQVIMRDVVSIVRSRDGVLKPGQTRDFRLPFDTVPPSWSQAMPQLVIAQVLF